MDRKGCVNLISVDFENPNGWSAAPHYGEYIVIQEKIREYISKNMPERTPFEAEFEIRSDLYYGE